MIAGQIVNKEIYEKVELCMQERSTEREADRVEERGGRRRREEEETVKKKGKEKEMMMIMIRNRKREEEDKKVRNESHAMKIEGQRTEILLAR